MTTYQVSHNRPRPANEL